MGNPSSWCLPENTLSAPKDKLHRELSRLATKPRLVLDFSEVSSMDSTCIAELMRMEQKRTAGPHVEYAFCGDDGTAKVPVDYERAATITA